MEGNRGTPKKLKINRDRERDESERQREMRRVENAREGRRG
jgi:hypothetical protein